MYFIFNSNVLLAFSLKFLVIFLNLKLFLPKKILSVPLFLYCYIRLASSLVLLALVLHFGLESESETVHGENDRARVKERRFVVCVYYSATVSLIERERRGRG